MRTQTQGQFVTGAMRLRCRIPLAGFLFSRNLSCEEKERSPEEGEDR